MSIKPYPVMMDMEQKSACVIGGGKVAKRKVKRLIESGALVTVIAPELSDEMLALYKNNSFIWIDRTFQIEDLNDQFIVIAATNCETTNQFVANSSLPNQLVNVAHDKELGNFHVPASFSQGKLTVSVGTSGASPMLAKKIKEELEQKYNDTYIGYLEFLEVARRTVHNLKTIDHQQKIQLLNEITDPLYIEKDAQQTMLLYIHILSMTHQNPNKILPNPVHSL